MTVSTKPINYLDHFVFKWCTESLVGKSPEEIVKFYVENFIFKNDTYFKMIVDEYHLPNDFLRLHKKVTELSNLAYKS